MLSRTTEYALRTVVWLANHPDQSWKNDKIADGTRVPASYLSKVIQSLRRADLIRSHRGSRGGFTLSRSPGRITMLDVINAVAPIRRIRKCPLELDSHGGELCLLHGQLDEVAALIEEVFRKTTVAKLAKTPSQQKPLCQAKQAPRPVTT